MQPTRTLIEAIYMGGGKAKLPAASRTTIVCALLARLGTAMQPPLSPPATKERPSGGGNSPTAPQRRRTNLAGLFAS